MTKQKELSLYVHIPFCVRKCHYCDFLSAPADELTMKQYVNALLGEIQAYRDTPLKERQVKTIFFGGGTPSILPAEAIGQILEEIKITFNISENAFKQLEITLEMNPGTVTPEKCRSYRTMGINRVSIGLQSCRDESLRILGRIHTYKDFMSTYETVRNIGFQNVNLDLISALPGQTTDDYAADLAQVARLAPEHISAYSLIIEEGTLFYDWYGEQNDRKNEKLRGYLRNKITPLPLPDEDSERKMYELTEMVLTRYGYERYEISNYAKKGHECQHNIVYWRRGDYLGLGLGAASLIDGERFSNTDDLNTYIEYQMFSVENPRKKPVDLFKITRYSGEEGREEAVESLYWEQSIRKELCKLEITDEMEEFMFLGLRMTEGISEKRFAELFHSPLMQVYGEVIEKFVSQGLLRWSDQGKEGRRLALTDRGIDVSNFIFAQFLF